MQPIIKYDSEQETRAHIAQVRKYIFNVIQRLEDKANQHDASKLYPPEKEIFDKTTQRLKTSTYGSDEYKIMLKEMGPALEHHYEHNRHHPEHFKEYECNGCFKLFNEQPNNCDICGYSQFTIKNVGISGMNLLDVIEMLCDWKAATLRHGNGDIRKSLDYNSNRFGFRATVLHQILANTIDDLGF